jgi:hypothetical protein
VDLAQAVTDQVGDVVVGFGAYDGDQVVNAGYRIDFRYLGNLGQFFRDFVNLVFLDVEQNDKCDCIERLNGNVDRFFDG